MKWLIGIVLTLSVALLYGQVRHILSIGQFTGVVNALGLGLSGTLITGILGPYFLFNDPKAKSISIGIIVWIILLGIHWLIVSGYLVSGPLVQHAS